MENRQMHHQFGQQPPKLPQGYQSQWLPSQGAPLPAQHPYTAQHPYAQSPALLSQHQNYYRVHQQPTTPYLQSPFPPGYNLTAPHYSPNGHPLPSLLRATPSYSPKLNPTSQARPAHLLHYSAPGVLPHRERINELAWPGKLPEVPHVGGMSQQPTALQLPQPVVQSFGLGDGEKTTLTSRRPIGTYANRNLDNHTKALASSGSEPKARQRGTHFQTRVDPQEISQAYGPPDAKGKRKANDVEIPTSKRVHFGTEASGTTDSAMETGTESRSTAPILLARPTTRAAPHTAHLSPMQVAVIFRIMSMSYAASGQPRAPLPSDIPSFLDSLLKKYYDVTRRTNEHPLYSGNPAYAGNTIASQPVSNLSQSMTYTNVPSASTSLTVPLSSPSGSRGMHAVTRSSTIDASTRTPNPKPTGVSNSSPAVCPSLVEAAPPEPSRRGSSSKLARHPTQSSFATSSTSSYNGVIQKPSTIPSLPSAAVSKMALPGTSSATRENGSEGKQSCAPPQTVAVNIEASHRSSFPYSKSVAPEGSAPKVHVPVVVAAAATSLSGLALPGMSTGSMDVTNVEDVAFSASGETDLFGEEDEGDLFGGNDSD